MKTGCALAGLALAVGLAGAAQAAPVRVTLDFEEIDLTGASAIGRLVPQPYAAGPYRITDPGSSFFAFPPSATATWTGSVALFASNVGTTTTLSRVDGGAFDLISLDLSEGNTASSAASLIFTGTLLAGGTTSFGLTLDGTFGMETVGFQGFADVTSVSWQATGSRPASYQFDNIVVSSLTPIPLPAGLPLLAAGLAGLALARRRRG